MKKLLYIFFFLYFVGSVFAFLLIATTRVDIEENIIIRKEDELLNDKTKDEAEKLNLKQIKTILKSDVLYSFSNESAAEYINKELGLSLENFDYKFVSFLELQSDFSLNTVNQVSKHEDGKKVFYVVHPSDDLIKNPIFDLNSDKLFDSIKSVFIKNKIKNLFFAKEFTKFKNFDHVLQNLQQMRNSLDIVLGVFCYPVWGHEVNYNHFFQLINKTVTPSSLNQLNDLVDIWVIDAFGFTNEYSILPFKISDLDLVERTVQFFISEGVPSSKIILNVETNLYVWPNREILNLYRENYSSSEQQAIIKPQDSYLNLSSEDLIKNIDYNMFYRDKESNQIIVKIHTDLIKSIIDLGKEYSLYAINFN